MFRLFKKYKIHIYLAKQVDDDMMMIVIQKIDMCILENENC